MKDLTRDEIIRTLHVNKALLNKIANHTTFNEITTQIEDIKQATKDLAKWEHDITPMHKESDIIIDRIKSIERSLQALKIYLEDYISETQRQVANEHPIHLIEYAEILKSYDPIGYKEMLETLRTPDAHKQRLQALSNPCNQ